MFLGMLLISYNCIFTGLKLIYIKSRLIGYDFCELRIDLEDWNGTKTHAHYGKFLVEEPESSYRLFVSAYNGDAGKHSYECTI